MPRPEPTAGELRPRGGSPGPLPWLWLGSWGLGGEGFGPHHDRQAREVVERALEEGIRFFDTAGLYGRGRAERLFGRVLGGSRHEVFLATKGGLEWQGRRVVHRARPEDLERQLAASLERLATDHVDLYQLHWPDPEVPLDESLAALAELVTAGLARLWGVGNLGAAAICRHLVAGGRVPLQLPLNPLQRSSEEIAAATADRRARVLAYSPFAQGLLSGGRASAGLVALGRRDVRRRNPLFSDPAALAWAAELHRLADSAPSPRAPLLLLWALAQPGVEAVIVGPRTPPQLAEILTHQRWRRPAAAYEPDDGPHRGWRQALATVCPAPLAAHLERPPPRAR